KQLLSGEDPERSWLQGRKEEFRKEHYERLSVVNLEEMDDQLKTLCFIVKLLRDAASKKQRFRNIVAELAETLKAKAQNLGLEDEMRSLLAVYGSYPGQPEFVRRLYEGLFVPGYVPVDKLEEKRNKLRQEPKPEPVEPQSSAKDKSPKKAAPRV